MGEGNEGGADKADAAKGAKEKEKSVMDQPKEPDEKPKTAPDEGKPTTPPVKATESEPAKADQSPAVLNKNPDPKEKQRIVVFKVTQEKKPVWSEIKIQNPSNDQKTFKVKCTSADFFRVQPPLGLIKPNDTSRIRVWFQNANGIPTDGKKHYFAIYYMNSTQGKTVKDMWTKDAKHEGICRINVKFENKGEATEKPQQSIEGEAKKSS